MHQRERAAALRRQLPPGAAAVEDSEFHGGPPDLCSGDEPAIDGPSGVVRHAGVDS